MSVLSDIINGLIRGLADALGGQKSRSGTGAGGAGAPKLKSKPQQKRTSSTSAPSSYDESMEPGRLAGSETIQLDPDRLKSVRVAYAPNRNGDPDAGEVIWTWVPYEENDGRGKDRPVLVIGRQSATRVYAVRMTSKAHDGDRDYIPIGPGAWDSQGRPSWVDIEQLYSVHVKGTRREAATLDRARYIVVAKALIQRYGWAVGE